MEPGAQAAAAAGLQVGLGLVLLRGHGSQPAARGQRGGQGGNERVVELAQGVAECQEVVGTVAGHVIVEGQAPAQGADRVQVVTT